MTNLKKNIRANSGKKMGFVALVVWEIWPVEVEKGCFVWPKNLIFGHSGACNLLRNT